MQTTWSLKKANTYPKLDKDLAADVTIIGGGLAGILTAYQLVQAGKRVVVLEAGRIGTGATEYTTAFITQVIDTDPPQMISLYGLKQARQIWQSHSAAINAIERIVALEGIECEFTRCSNFVFACDENEYKTLEVQTQAIGKFGGDVALKKGDLAFPCYGYLEVKNQAKFNATEFLTQLAKRVSERGGLIFENSEVIKISGRKIFTVKTKEHQVRSDYTITVTYQPFDNPKETFAKKGMYVSYVFEVDVPHGVFREATYEDLENPYHYFRIDRNPGAATDRMIIGGEDHRQEIKMSPQKNYRALKAYLKQLMGARSYSIVRRWRGPILEPSDGIALIGEYKPQQLVACAFSGNGMTYSTITSLLLKDIILGKKNNWIALYDPKRTPSLKQLLVKGKDYTEELFKGAVKNVFK